MRQSAIGLKQTAQVGAGYIGRALPHQPRHGHLVAFGLGKAVVDHELLENCAVDDVRYRSIIRLLLPVDLAARKDLLQQDR